MLTPHPSSTIMSMGIIKSIGEELQPPTGSQKRHNHRGFFRNAPRAAAAAAESLTEGRRRRPCNPRSRRKCRGRNRPCSNRNIRRLPTGKGPAAAAAAAAESTSRGRFCCYGTQSEVVRAM